MKYHIVKLIRLLGLLKFADTVKLWQHQLRYAWRNRTFRKLHPNFPVPPYDLAYDAYNHANWKGYYDEGLAHARMFSQIIKENFNTNSLTVLEWGCGPGRVIRHLPDLLRGHAVKIVGSDYNPSSISWCADNLDGIEFAQNELMPPLHFPDAHFDVAYNISVFTHLAVDTQRAWAVEMWRVLKPGGILISTTHGERHRSLLVSKKDRDKYNAGDVVIQGNYQEGKKWYFSIHPANFVKDKLFKEFPDVEQYRGDGSDKLRQDIWIARKPMAGETINLLFQ